MTLNRLPLGKMHLLGGLLLALTAGVSAATFPVTSTDDSGAGTLREAIIQANTTVESDTIDFSSLAAGGVTIECDSQLPTILHPLIIDGTTKSDYAGVPLIRVSGASAGSSASGLWIQASDCMVRGLIITGWSGRGILIHGSNNTVQGCYIGTDGTTASSNAYGVTVSGTSISGNRVGGPGTGEGNVISGNSTGLQISGLSASETTIQGNIIGLNAAGTAAVPNETYGISIVGSPDTLIGGTADGEGNVISGNTGYGVTVTSPSSAGTLIQGNRIGTDASGTVAMGNGNYGVYLTSSHSVTVGGTLPGAGNLISDNSRGVFIGGTGENGNVIVGNYIGTNAEGTAVLGSQDYGIFDTGEDTVIGGTDPGAGNLVSGNSITGIATSGASGATIQGNIVGTNGTGTAALPNQTGIGVYSASGQVVVGGSLPGAGNLVSGNTLNGIVIQFSTSILVMGNRVGTDGTGTADLGNGLFGIVVSQSEETTVGGSLASGNLVSGNNAAGIYVQNSDSIAIQGNRIGVSEDGAALGNLSNGVRISNSSGVLVGGTGEGEGNTIAHNGVTGVMTQNGALDTRILSNIIRDNAGSGGIDVKNDGVTSNDSLDADGVTNKPLIGGVDNSNLSAVTVQTSLSAAPSTEYLIEYFSTLTAKAEGAEILYQTTVTTDPGGQAALSPTFPVTTPLPTGAYVTATATPTGSGGTSEFSTPGYVPVMLSAITIE